MNRLFCSICLLYFVLIYSRIPAQTLPALTYNNPGLEVDLGVGLWAWPLPMDYDQDGDWDLVISCPDVPYDGIYFFENPDGDVEMPVFKPGKRIGPSERYLQISHVGDKPVVLSPGTQYLDFRKHALESPKAIPLVIDFEELHGRTRANQWTYLDYEADGDLDLIIGLGVWEAYGWDNAYDSLGMWTNGPLHGYVYLSLNEGTTDLPDYQAPQKLLIGENPIDVYGMPSPCFADFDGDGDLDLICGEFLDGFTYFPNIGSRTSPIYGSGHRLTYQNRPIHMDLQMITPTAIDWNKDGHMDLIVGDEDGRVAWVKHSGKLSNGIPQFYPPSYFQQEADEVKFGALVTPFSYDWDADGDEDLICGNTAGYVGWIENLDGGNPPRWAAPELLEADGQRIRLGAGPNGSIQGPCEAKWGYSTLSVADWNHDNLPDIILNSIWGKVIWFQNVGTIHHPLLTSPRPLTVEWETTPPKPAWNWWHPQDRELATQWRTSPYVVDWNQDGLHDLIMLDQEGYLAFFERIRIQNQLRLLPPNRIFLGKHESVYDSKNRPQNGEPAQFLQLNHRIGGGSGRRKFCLADWDQDGELDLLTNSVNVDFFKQLSPPSADQILFQNMGPVHGHTLAGHTTSPTTVDWDKNGIPDLLIGAEDGRLYYMKNPLSD
ncbi:MAG: VCBS repeat-containing protein [Bacteroidota bacterium]